MKWLVRELRDLTGLTQRKFAETYHIPLSTLQKWEQGEASPAPYVVELLARSIPGAGEGKLQEKVIYKKEIYYYCQVKSEVSDAQGNTIKILGKLDGVKRQNLGLYLHDLFESFYEVRDRFERDCRYDLEEDMIWTELEE